ncbi:MAG TPA: hypothetical protein VJV78_44525 [Polyangiales bacterium]|nr:hypothetical protein [Polyangiales bacterium]
MRSRRSVSPARRRSTIGLLASLWLASTAAFAAAPAHAQKIGYFVTRYTSAGAPDPSFGSSGALLGQLSGDPSLVVVRSVGASPFGDGTIVGAGYFDPSSANTTDAGAYRMVIGRFNANGSPDFSFGYAGVTTAHFQGSDRAQAVGFQTSRTIVVAGTSCCGSSLNDARVFVTRFNWNGAQDSAFGGSVFSGQAGFAIALRSTSTELAGMVIDARDAIYVVATFEAGIGLAKFTATGTLDTSFGPSRSGTVSVAKGSPATVATGIALDRAGNVVVSGTRRQAPAQGFIVRLTPAGVLDLSFGSGGTTVIPNATECHDVAADASGNVFAYCNMTNGMVGVQRLNARGQIDSTFARTFAFSGQQSQSADRLQVASDGTILLSADTVAASSAAFGVGVARLTVNGALDAGFGTRGQTVTTFPGFRPFAFGVARDGSGNALLCGEAAPTQ